MRRLGVSARQRYMIVMLSDQSYAAVGGWLVVHFAQGRDPSKTCPSQRQDVTPVESSTVSQLSFQALILGMNAD